MKRTSLKIRNKLSYFKSFEKVIMFKSTLVYVGLPWFTLCIQCPFNVYSLYIQCVFNVNNIL